MLDPATCPRQVAYEDPGHAHGRKRMPRRLLERLYPAFEGTVVNVLIAALMVAVLYATVVFVGTLIAAIVSTDVMAALSDASRDGTTIGNSLLPMQEDLFDVFGGFLLILLGIELIGTVRAMVGETRVAVESIVSIALIASARHLITIDFYDVEPLVIFGAGFVVFVLIVGAYLLRLDRAATHRATSASRSIDAPVEPDR